MTPKLMDFGRYSKHRIVRATLLPGGAGTRVLLTGTENLMDGDRTEKRKQIDSRMTGDSGKLWTRIVAIARVLDSTQVPAAAIKPEKAS